jgi:hypothetical protein
VRYNRLQQKGPFSLPFSAKTPLSRSRREVVITVELLHNPPVVFFDEPCDRLDANAAVTSHYRGWEISSSTYDEFERR